MRSYKHNLGGSFFCRGEDGWEMSDRQPSIFISFATGDRVKALEIDKALQGAPARLGGELADIDVVVDQP